MPDVFALLIHAACFWGSAWLAGLRAEWLVAWAACYLGGAAYLLLSVWFPGLRWSATRASKVLGYSILLASMVWGANFALDALGGSVATRRTPAELRSGLPPQFILVPGVASMAIGALAAGLWRRAGRHRRERRS